MSDTQSSASPIRLTQLAHGGGCGCKIAPGVLEQILAKTAPPFMPPQLLVGIETSDDAAVWQLNDSQAIIATTDFFMPVVDDPFHFGQIAATNAISDIYAMGGNVKAAALSGINTERLTFYIFAIMGALAGLAGLIFAARLNMATPKAGAGMELDVIAAVFIGGASMTGGSGKIIGVVVGALIMGVMNNGMSILGIGIDYQQVIKGLVLLAAVIFDVYNKNK